MHIKPHPSLLMGIILYILSYLHDRNIIVSLHFGLDKTALQLGILSKGTCHLPKQWAEFVPNILTPLPLPPHSTSRGAIIWTTSSLSCFDRDNDNRTLWWKAGLVAIVCVCVSTVSRCGPLPPSQPPPPTTAPPPYSLPPPPRHQPPELWKATAFLKALNWGRGWGGGGAPVEVLPSSLTLRRATLPGSGVLLSRNAIPPICVVRVRTVLTASWELGSAEVVSQPTWHNSCDAKVPALFHAQFHAKAEQILFEILETQKQDYNVVLLAKNKQHRCWGHYEIMALS